MSLDLLAIDLGKQSFHIHGIDSDGVIISRKISRTKLMGAIEELAPARLAPARIIGADSSSQRAIGSG
jgi:transposase